MQLRSLLLLLAGALLPAAQAVLRQTILTVGHLPVLVVHGTDGGCLNRLPMVRTTQTAWHAPLGSSTGRPLALI